MNDARGMGLGRAIAYFAREAGTNLARSWKISLLAVSTIAVSLFIGGVFMLVLQNLSRLVERWRDEAKVVVYLRAGTDLDAPEMGGLRELAGGQPWVRGVEEVTAAEARERFQRHFPSVADLLEGWGGGEPLPASLELTFDPLVGEPGAFESWLGELRGHPAVAMVDDDRDWVAQLEAALHVVAAVGLLLGAVLLGAAIFTIASVIRLTAYLYREEIAVMRLVGATELFIRGPFYVEGLVQGTIGGAVALAALWATYRFGLPREPGSLLAGAVQQFLPLAQQAVLVALGALAGLAGAVVSLRREEL